MSLALRIAASDNSSEARWVLAELKAFVPLNRPLVILLLSIFPLIPAFFNFCIADDCRSPNLQFRIYAQRALPLFSFVRADNQLTNMFGLYIGDPGPCSFAILEQKNFAFSTRFLKICSLLFD